VRLDANAFPVRLRDRADGATVRPLSTKSAKCGSSLRTSPGFARPSAGVHTARCTSPFVDEI
jgi:hypothetical protein